MGAKKAVYAAGAVLLLVACCAVGLVGVYFPPPVTMFRVGANMRSAWDMLGGVMMILGVAAVGCWLSSLGVVAIRVRSADSGDDDDDPPPDPAPGPDDGAALTVPEEWTERADK